MTRASAPLDRSPLDVLKGHGTENDFVLVVDLTGRRPIAEHLVRALCDRRAGLGGDGLIRLVPTAAVDDAPAGLAAEGAEWFMDYRNADGSVAQMCGNGVRVTAALAERLGLWDGAGPLVLGTRAGARTVTATSGPDGTPWYAVDMGPWRATGADEAFAAGADAEVLVPGLAVARPALSFDLGNPHTVLALADVEELERADLTRAPVVEPRPPEGTNVELVVPQGEVLGSEGAGGPAQGRLRMRVHERGVGETRSCGTGACAAALAVRAWAGPGAPTTWWVDVPGGLLRVRVTASAPDGRSGRVELAGPARLVAEAQIDLSSLAGSGPAQEAEAGPASDR